MPTVEEILRDSGFSSDEITALDKRAITAFSGVLSQAEREKADNVAFYENSIVPALTGWDEEKQRIENEKARVAAEAAFYRTQNEAARSAGFIASDAPGFTPRDQGGRYVANAPGGTPGSPQFFDVNKVYERAGDAVGAISDVDWKHRQLFDKPLPISPSELIKQADARRMNPMAYADQTFGFQKREQELQQKRQEEHDAAIRKDAVAERDKYWSERTGSNPDVRRPMESPRMTQISRATREGKPFGPDGVVLKDPLLLNEGERRSQTRVAIRSELSEQSS